jgi:glycosyltransferase involved in cell wall biosynthesis
MMRIGMVAPPWIQVPPPAYGGTEAVIDALARGLTRLGHEVILAAAAGSTCPVEMLPAAPADSVGEIGDKEQELKHVAHAYAALLARDVDIVHDHTQAGMFYAQQSIGIPIALTVHGPFLPEVQKLLQGSGCEVVAISHHQAETAGPVKIGRVIHHGIDVSEIEAGHGTGGYLSFLGRITPDKGIREAIEVATSAGVPLLIAAKMREQAERDYFADTIRPLLSARVEYLGEVTVEEKLELLRGSIALLNPIQWPEPFGMVMIESMAVGTPVIATPQGSAPEIVVDGVTGFLRSTLEGLAVAVSEVAGLDRGRIRAHVEAHFSMGRMAGDYARFFESLIARRDDDPTPAEVAGF